MLLMLLLSMTVAVAVVLILLLLAAIRPLKMTALVASVYEQLSD